MPDRELFSISTFARFSRTTRDTLLHYDKIGLLSPVGRAKNGYRIYSPDQLAMVNLIRTCQTLGMQLSEIKEISENRTPEQIHELLTYQIKRIDENLKEWNRARKLLSHLKDTIKSVLDVDTDKIAAEFLPEEKIFMGELNDYSGGRNDYDALISFYHDMNKKYPDMDMNYPVWGCFSKERILKGDWFWPDRYYYSNPEGFEVRPSGLYAVGYGKGGYGENEELYKKMMEFIKNNGYEISGDSYTEYPLNEISVTDPSDYLMRTMITVKKKVVL